jgi:3-dehydroquinate synthase
MKTISLSDYQIYLGNIRTTLPPLLQAYAGHTIFILVDTHTALHCLPAVWECIPDNTPRHTISIPAGEQHKNIDTCATIWSALLRHEADRHTLLINLGGGVIGDMGGFCAATYKRGIDFIQIPTTLLAQVDASVGGKLGIDFGGIKNSIGAFRNPRAVCIDTDFLHTLDPRERLSGWAEVLKHALIADAGMWTKLLQDELPIDEVVYRSLQIKQGIVEADPYEKGIRKALNFGHTVGHAIEALLLDTPQPLRHGEAIAVGMIAEAYLSVQYAGLDALALEDLTKNILRYYALPKIATSHFDALIALMYNDKKNTRKDINFTLLKALGHAETDYHCSEKAIADSLSYYNQCLSKT